MSNYKENRNKEGLLHRLDGPAIELADSSKQWWFNGKRHRIDGPAIERANGNKLWYLNGKLHREDGPAIEFANGYKEWYFNSNHIKCSSQEEFEKLIKLKAFW